MLEAKTERLSQDIEALKREIQAEGIREEQITRIESRTKGIEQSCSELKERMVKLERRGITSGFPSASQPEVSIETEQLPLNPNLKPRCLKRLTRI